MKGFGLRIPFPESVVGGLHGHVVGAAYRLEVAPFTESDPGNAEQRGCKRQAAANSGCKEIGGQGDCQCAAKGEQGEPTIALQH